MAKDSMYHAIDLSSSLGTELVDRFVVTQFGSLVNKLKIKSQSITYSLMEQDKIVVFTTTLFFLINF